MSSQLIVAVILIATLTTGLGYLIAVKAPHLTNTKLFRKFISVGTGLLMFICFVEFFPQVYGHSSMQAGVLVFLGLFLIILFEKEVAPRFQFIENNECNHDHGVGQDHPHHHHSPSHEHHLISHGAACSAIGCLLVCTMFDGLQLSAAFSVGSDTGWFTMAGLLVHVVPDGALAAGLAVAGGIQERWRKIIPLLVGGALIFGVGASQIIGFYFSFNEVLVPIAAGVLLYVCFIHLLPVAVRDRSGILWMVVGMAAMYAVHHFLIQGGHHHVH